MSPRSGFRARLRSALIRSPWPTTKPLSFSPAPGRRASARAPHAVHRRRRRAPRRRGDRPSCVSRWSPGSTPIRTGGPDHRLFPVGCLTFLGLVVTSAVASGGGRELLRDGAAAYPVSPLVDRLGALLLAPLSVAWLFQAWTLLGVAAYLVAPVAVLPAVVVVLAWLCAATAAGQVAGWSAEAVRRTRHGKALLRGALGARCPGRGLAGPARTGLDLGDPTALASSPMRSGTRSAPPGWPPCSACWLLTVALVLVGALPARSAAPAAAQGRGPSRDRQPPGPPAPGERLRRAAPHRPGLGPAVAAAAPRPDHPRASRPA